MKAWAVEGAFGLQNLKQVERPVLDPGPGRVRLRMLAVSLNFRDLLMIRGHYNPKQKLPLVPLSDGVGIVDAVGAGVTRVKVGDRVAGIFAQAWLSGQPTTPQLRTTLGGPLDGTLAEYVELSAEGVVHVPAHLTDEEAATLPCAGVTAWSSLVPMGGVVAGQRVLVLGTGGVSIFALQFAKLLGAEVIATSSSDEKLEQARALGATHTINYRQTPEWWKEVRRVTNDEGVDLVVEVGGAGTFDQSVRSTRPGGIVSLIGVLTGAESPVNLTRVLMQNIRIQGVIVGPRAAFEAMNRAVDVHKLRPVVDRVYGFDDVQQAFDDMANGRHVGKIVVRVNA